MSGPSSSSSSDLLFNDAAMATVGTSTSGLEDVECTTNTPNTGGGGTAANQLSMLETSASNASLLKLRTEFSLIIRTLSVLQRLEDAEETTSVVNLFKSLTEVIQTFPPLSLSAYWFMNDSNRSASFDGSSCLVSKPVAQKDIENAMQSQEKDDPHDPLQIVQFLWERAHSTLQNLNTTREQRVILIDFLHSLAVKSGRVTLLLDVLRLVNRYGVECSGLSPAKVRDLYAYVQESDIDKEDSDVITGGNESKGSKEDSKTEDPSMNRICMQMDDDELWCRNANAYVQHSNVNRNAVARNCLMTFGKADHGKLGHGDAQIQRTLPTVVESLQHSNIISVASMSTYSLAVDSNGTTYVWGTGGSAGSNHGHRTDLAPQILEALPPKVRIAGVSCGLGHTLFLTDNGQVYTWGNGGNGRLGLGDTLDRAEATLIVTFATNSEKSQQLHQQSLPIITSVQCGACHSIALSVNGSVYIWGKNSQGQCGLGHTDDTLRPTVISSLLLTDTIMQIAAGWEHSLARSSNGTLYSWGSGYKDSRRGLVPPVLGIGSNEGRAFPEPLTSLNGIFMRSVACGWDHCLALDDKGRCYSWGSGQNGKLGHGNDDNSVIPVMISSIETINITAISAGCEHSAAICENGYLYTWGQGDGGRLGHGNCISSNVPKMVEAVQPRKDMTNVKVYCCDKFTMLIACNMVDKFGSIVDGDTTHKATDTSRDQKENERLSWLSRPTLSLQAVAKDEDRFLNRVFKLMDTNIRRFETSASEAKDAELPLSPNRNEVASTALLSLMTRAALKNKEAIASFLQSSPRKVIDKHDKKNRTKAKEYSYESSPYVFVYINELIKRVADEIEVPFSEILPDDLHFSQQSKGMPVDSKPVHGVSNVYSQLILLLKILEHNLEALGSITTEAKLHSALSLSTDDETAPPKLLKAKKTPGKNVFTTARSHLAALNEGEATTSQVIASGYRPLDQSSSMHANSSAAIIIDSSQSADSLLMPIDHTRSMEPIIIYTDHHLNPDGTTTTSQYDDANNHIEIYDGGEASDADDDHDDEESAGEKLETSIDFSVEGGSNAGNGNESTLEFNRDALLNTTDNDVFSPLLDNATNTTEEPVPRRSTQTQSNTSADSPTEAVEEVENENENENDSFNLEASADFSVSMDATELLDRTIDTDATDVINAYNDGTDILSASFDSTNGHLMSSPIQHSNSNGGTLGETKDEIYDTSSEINRRVHRTANATIAADDDEKCVPDNLNSHEEENIFITPITDSEDIMDEKLHEDYHDSPIMDMENGLDYLTDDDNELDMYFEETEINFSADIQQAILASIQHDELQEHKSDDDDDDDDDYDDNEVYSNVMRTFSGLKDTLLAVGKHIFYENSNFMKFRGILTIQQFLGWKNIQSVIASGFCALFDFPKYEDIITEIVICPIKYLYVLPGILQGIKGLPRREMNLPNITWKCIDESKSKDYGNGGSDINIDELSSYFEFAHSYITKPPNEDFKSYIHLMYHEISLGLISVVGILFRSLIISPTMCMDQSTHIDFKRLDSVLEYVLFSSINDIKKSLKSNQNGNLHHLYSFDLLRMLITSISEEFTSSEGLKIDAAQFSSSSRSRSTVLTFVPFLKILLKELVDMHRHSVKLDSNTKCTLTELIESIIVAIATGIAILGQLAPRSIKTRYVMGNDFTSANSVDIFNVQKARTLFSVDAYINANVNLQNDLDNLVCLDKRFVKLLRAIHFEYKNSSDDNEIIVSKTISNLHGLIFVTQYVCATKGFASLQDANKAGLHAGTDAAAVFTTINSQLLGLNTSSHTEKYAANMIAFTALYDCFMLQLSPNYDSNDVRKTERNVDDKEILAWMYSYEVLTLLICFIPDDATCEERDLYMMEITRRIKISSSSGLVNLTHVSSGVSITVESLVDEFLETFNEKQAKLQSLLSNPYKDVECLASLRIGWTGTSNGYSENRNDDANLADAVLEETANEKYHSMDVMTTFLNFLMSSTSINFVIHANVHDLVATDCMTFFMSLVKDVTLELCDDEYSALPSVEEDQSRNIDFFGTFVETLRQLRQHPEMAHQVDFGKDHVYTATNQSMYSISSDCESLIESILVNIPQIDEIMVSIVTKMLSKGSNMTTVDRSNLCVRRIFDVLFLLKSCISCTGECVLLKQEKQEVLLNLKSPLVCLEYLFSLFSVTLSEKQKSKSVPFIWEEINCGRKNAQFLSVTQNISEAFIYIHCIYTWNNMLPIPSCVEDSTLSKIFHPTVSSLLKSNMQVLQTLCASQKDVIETYLSKHSFFLYSGIKRIECSSPMIIPNAFSVRGDYTLGFWLFVPSSVVLARNEMLGKSLHLISRVQETGDFNLNVLVGSKEIAAECNHSDDEQLSCGYNPTVRLLVDEKGECKILVKCKSSLSSAIIISNAIPAGRWLNCCIGITLSSETQRNGITTGSSYKQYDHGELVLQIITNNGDKSFVHDTKSTEGLFPRVSPHQNVIIGQIPTSIFALYNETYDGHAAVGNFELSVCDITWNAIKFMREETGCNLLSPPSILSACIKEVTCCIDQILALYADFMISVEAVNEKHMEAISVSIDVALRILILAPEELQARSFSIMLSALKKRSIFVTHRNNLLDVISTMYGMFQEVFVPNVDVVGFLKQFAVQDLLSMWRVRISCQRCEVSRLLNVVGWCGLFEHLSENFILTNLSIALMHINDDDTLKDVVPETFFWYKFGGWPVAMHTGSVIDHPSKVPFYWSTQVTSAEQPPFLVAATVKAINRQSLPNHRRVAGGLELCLEIVDGVQDINIKSSLCKDGNLLPLGHPSVLPLSTEIAFLRDNISLDRLSSSLHKLNSVDPSLPPDIMYTMWPSVNDLLKVLRKTVSFSLAEINTKNFGSYYAGSTPSMRYSGQLEEVENLCSESLLLTKMTMRFRIFCVQLEKAEIDGAEDDMTKILDYLFENIQILCHFASKDPVSTVSSVFEAGSEKGAQLDVLKNLLKEDDIPFLEKLNLRIWKQLYLNKLYSTSPSIAVHLCMSPLAGEVSIIDNKVKAVSHFPSVKLNDVSLQRMTGRWFYEVILLSDGLMQIGWADNHFRCDPSCGQGVGDHHHSWAYDGLRMKKWCVSCDNYGKKWRAGDVVGVLIDMDLLEMTYFLNGESLGPAFVGFHVSGLFPALSLNIRQSLRVNFGFASFIYPPDEIDGFPFRPICEAVLKEGTNINMLRTGREGEDGGDAYDESNLESHQDGDDDDDDDDGLNGDDTLNESVDRIVARFDDTNIGPTAMTPIRGVDIQERHITVGGDNDSECGGSDDEDEDDDIDEEEDEDDVSDHRWAAELGEADEDGGEESHQHEIRRQVLVENLIGMGFPIDWALRAAENCESSISESAAISWIIERMELEQAKIDGNYSADSSRADEGDFDGNYGDNVTGGGNNIRESLQRIDSHQTSSGGGGNVATGGGGIAISTNSDGVGTSDEKYAENETHTDMNLMNVIPNSVICDMGGSNTAAACTSTNDESAVVININDASSISGKGSDITGVNNLSSTRTTRYIESQDLDAGSTSSDFILLDDATSNCMWNEENVMPSCFFDRDSLRRRNEQDKQEVLTQITELDAGEMCPIIASCQFTLCILYARRLVLKLLILSLKNEVHRSNAPNGNLLNERLKCFSSLPTAGFLVNVLQIACKQTLPMFSQGSRLFPFPILSYSHNDGGKDLVRTPATAPFFCARQVAYRQLLAWVEKRLSPNSIGSFSVEEAPEQAFQAASSLIHALFSDEHKIVNIYRCVDEVDNSDKTDISVEKKALSDLTETERFAFLLLDDAIEILEHASTRHLQDRLDWLCVHKDDNDAAGIIAKPYIFWAYCLIKKILMIHTHYVETESCQLPNRLLNVLLVCCRSNNASLRYCVHDLITIIAGIRNLSFNNKSMLKNGMNSIVRDKRMLIEFAERVRSEVSTTSSRWMISNYTWRSLLFLRKWKELVVPEIENNYIRKEMLADCKFITSANPFPIYDIISATKFSSTSVTVSWLLNDTIVSTPDSPQSDEQKNNCVLLLKGISNFDSYTFTSSVENIDSYGLHRFDNLRPGSLYEVTITRNDAAMGMTTGLRHAISANTTYRYDGSSSTPSSPRSYLSPANVDSSSMPMPPPSTDAAVTEGDKSTFRTGSHHNEAPNVNNGHVTCFPGVKPLYVFTDPNETMLLDYDTLPPNLRISNGGLTVRNTVSKKWSTVRTTTCISSGVTCWDVRIDRCISKNIFVGVVTEQARLDNYVGCDRKGWAFLANKAIWHNKSKQKPYGELFRTGDVITVTLDLDMETLSFSLNGKSLGVAIDGLSVAVHGHFYPAFSLYNDDDQVSILPPRANMEGTPYQYSWSSSSAERILDRIDALSAVVNIIRQTHHDECNTPDNDVPTMRGKFALDDIQEIFHRYSSWCKQTCRSIRSIFVAGDIVTIFVSETACARVTSRVAIASDRLVPGHCLEWDGPSKVCQLLGYAANKLWFQWLHNGEYFGCTEEMLRQAVGKGVLETITGTPVASATLYKNVDVVSTVLGLHEFQEQLYFPQWRWSREEDEALILWLEDCVSKQYQIDPLLLSSKSIIEHVADVQNFPEILREIPLSLILIRVSLILMLNDLFLVLLPITASMTSALDGEYDYFARHNRNLNEIDRGNIGEIEWLFFEAKSYIFTQTKLNFAIEKTPSSQIIKNAPKQEDQMELGWGESRYPPVVEVEIEDEDELLAIIVSSVAVGSQSTLLSEARWRLLTGLQATYPCQFMKILEFHIDSDPSILSKLQQSIRAMNPSRLIWFSSISAPFPMPFSTIHSKWLPLRVRLLSLINATNAVSKDIPSDDLDWFHFASFLQVSAKQTEGFLKSVDDAKWGDLTAPEINLGLVYMHAAGVVCGLAMNLMHQFPATFPQLFLETLIEPPVDCSILSNVDTFADLKNTTDPSFEKHILMKVFALTFRRGIISIFPEIGLNLFTPNEFLRTFTRKLDLNIHDGDDDDMIVDDRDAKDVEETKYNDDGNVENADQKDFQEERQIIGSVGEAMSHDEGC